MLTAVLVAVAVATVVALVMAVGGLYFGIRLWLGL